MKIIKKVVWIIKRHPLLYYTRFKLLSKNSSIEEIEGHNYNLTNRKDDIPYCFFEINNQIFNNYKPTNDLELVKEAIQNRKENLTEFRLFKKRKIDEKLNFWNKSLLLLYSDDKPEIVFKILFVGLIFGLFTLQSFYPKLNSLSGAWLLGGIIATIFVVISNKHWRDRFYSNFIVGYWTYNVVRDGKGINKKELPSVPRIVKIYSENGKLKFSIFIADKSSEEFAKSIYTLHSNLGNKKGKIVYWYVVSNKLTARTKFNGVAYLDWKREKKWKKISHMTARYLGEETGNKGYVNYHRISKEEFERIKTLNYVNAV